MQLSITLKKNENQPLNLSAIACAVFALVALQPARGGETEPPTYKLAPQRGVEGQVQRFIGPRYHLGVSMQNVLCWIRAYGWVPGVQITALIPGSPAANSGLEVGDVIIWANDQNVQTWDQLTSAIARSTGLLS
jgi:membrane-associated protease RseP (regulator of RpoE activity)